MIARLERFSADLDQVVDVAVHRRIDQSYYLRKTEELQELVQRLRQLAERMDSLAPLLDITYKEAFCQWQHDQRWFNCYYLNRVARRSIL